MKLKSKDLILHLLYVSGRTAHEPIMGVTRFQKMVFLFEREIWSSFKFDTKIPESELPTFEPYYFGPFSAKLNEDLNFLSNLGFIEKSDINFESLDREEQQEIDVLLNDTHYKVSRDMIRSTFALSEKGKRFVESGKAGKLTPIQTQTLEEFKKRCTSVPLASLLKYVYVKYPSMTTKSQIRKSVLGSHA